MEVSGHLHAPVALPPVLIGGPQSQSERYGEDKTLPLLGIELRPARIPSLY
jgi:hypothetical protein